MSDDKEMVLVDDSNLKFELSSRGKKLEALMKSLGLIRRNSAQGQIEFSKFYKTKDGEVNTRLSVIFETGKLSERYGDLVGFVLTEQTFVSSDLTNIELTQNSVAGPDIMHIYNVLGEGSREDFSPEVRKMCEAKDCATETTHLHYDPSTKENICIVCFSKRLSEGLIPVDS